MNYCTKCQSYYQQPGTCNCFATVAPPIPMPFPQQPYMPYIGDRPPPDSPFWSIIPPTGTTTITWGWGNIGNSNTVEMGKAAGNQPPQRSLT